MGKRKILEVALRLFEADTGAGYGFTHEETWDDNYGNGFDPFYNGVGIFHDVFEHWFERRHRYFLDDFAMNVGGEMVASGATFYYTEDMSVTLRRLDDRPWAPRWETSLANSTKDLVIEAVNYGDCRYGQELLCMVPRQRPTETHLESDVVDRWWADYTREAEVGRRCNDEQEQEGAETYAASVKRWKVLDLHRYGYHMARRLIPNTCANDDTLNGFIRYWDRFCTTYTAEQLYEEFDVRRLVVRVYKERGDISWTARLYSSLGKSWLLGPDRDIPVFYE